MKDRGISGCSISTFTTAVAVADWFICKTLVHSLKPSVKLCAHVTYSDDIYEITKEMEILVFGLVILSGVVISKQPAASSLITALLIVIALHLYGYNIVLTQTSDWNRKHRLKQKRKSRKKRDDGGMCYPFINEEPAEDIFKGEEKTEGPKLNLNTDYSVEGLFWGTSVTPGAQQAASASMATRRKGGMSLSDDGIGRPLSFNIETHNTVPIQ